MDGTLLNSNKLITLRNYETLTHRHELGVHIVMATARPPRVANKLIKDLPFVD
ncbi:HAD family hydrolase [Ferroacidibacillus organovorans]|uniref:Uncharacterized protein n=1 Tax=Ferroacidibacillus organovorans TaxID=1765683 RepID=A0A1V4ET27_9BACL|nr:hypothetical protein B2M26_08605 [Ferroacidibacillus organovorans]